MQFTRDVFLTDGGLGQTDVSRFLRHVIFSLHSIIVSCDFHILTRLLDPKSWVAETDR